MLLESPARVDRMYPPEDADDRRALVKRIVASSSFAKSNRLSEFLKYVCNLAEKGRFDDIHEQSIGSAVFGRVQGYDPADDSIVRSHASRLRHRLKEYFEQEGRDEPLVLTIPRGSYIPVFELRPGAGEAIQIADPEPPPSPLLAAPADHTASAQEVSLRNPMSLDAAYAVGGDTAAPHDTSAVERSTRRTIALLWTALIASLLVAAALLTLLLWRTRTAARARIDADKTATLNPLWSQFLSPASGKTVVVSSDSGLVMYQHLTGRGVSLASYLSGDYLKDTSSPTVPDTIVRKFGTRRYTPALDLSVLDRMTRIFGDRRDHVSFAYARDLRIADLKAGNAILLGSTESNPWVQLFEPSMNFAFQDDLLHDRAQMRNRHPAPGEREHYDSTPQDAAPTIYGLVAFRPNLQSSGHVLILEGQTMAGTQTAADFVFDDSYLLPFLKKVMRPDGSLPYFEMLLRSTSFGGQSSRIEVVAYRVE